MYLFCFGFFVCLFVLGFVCCFFFGVFFFWGGGCFFCCCCFVFVLFFAHTRVHTNSPGELETSMQGGRDMHKQLVSFPKKKIDFPPSNISTGASL